MALSRPVLIALACLGLFVLSPIAMVASQSTMSSQQFNDDIGIHREPRYALDVNGDVAWNGQLLEGDVPFSRLVGAPRFQAGDGLVMTGGILADPYVVSLDESGLVGCDATKALVWNDANKRLECASVTGSMVADDTLTDVDITNSWTSTQDFAAGLRITTHANCLDNPLDRFGGTSPGVGNRAPCNANQYPSSGGCGGSAGETMIGEIKLVPYNFVPRGFAHASGQLIPIAQNTALFSLLGTQFGGNGVTTFALPDLRGLGPSGMTYIIALGGIFPSRC